MVGERGENVLGSLGKKGALYRSPRERAVAGKLTPETPVCPGRRLRPKPETPGSFRGVSGRATERRHPFDENPKFQTGDSGLGPETPAYTAKTAKRKSQ